MQLPSREEIRKDFVFRLGELHIVFAILKVMGKYIEESGLDRLLVEAGIYGETTLQQILAGNTWVEAHTTLFLALFRVYFSDWYQKNPAYKEPVEQLRRMLEDLPNEDMRENTSCLHDILNESGMLQQLNLFGDSLQHQGRYFRNYMKICEILLLFIRSSRQGMWTLHLSSMNAFAKYFFAHDQLNYARHTLLYIADMLSLRENYVKSWDYLKDNFSVSKSQIPFTSIGSYHAMEQQTKDLKVNGGIVGLTQKPSALNRLCLAAPLMNTLSDQYCDKYNIATGTKRTNHYQLANWIALADSVAM